MATRSPRLSPRLPRARAAPFAIASICAKLNCRGACSPPRSMIAILSRSRSRGIRSPRFWKRSMCRKGLSNDAARLWSRGAVEKDADRCDRRLSLIDKNKPDRASGNRVRSFRRRREIGAAAAGQKLAVGVENLRLGGGELAAAADHLA